MNKLWQYQIHIYGLSDKTHKFEFEFDETFFCLFENSLITKGSGSCEVILEKSASMINITMHVNGSVELVCDCSLEFFDYKINTKQVLIYKYGEEEKELSDNVFVIRKDTQKINISKELYEFISLKIPMKKLHPKFENRQESDELVYCSENESTEKNTDPRWEALKSLK